jgi:hypothetical protein
MAFVVLLPEMAVSELMRKEQFSNEFDLGDASGLQLAGLNQGSKATRRKLPSLLPAISGAALFVHRRSPNAKAPTGYGFSVIVE